MDDRDIIEIQKHILQHIEDYATNYMLLASALSFDDFIKEQITIDLRLKYNKYQIEEAFCNPKILSLLDFYSNEKEDTDYLH